MNETKKPYRITRIVDGGKPTKHAVRLFPVTGEQTQMFAAYAAVLPEKGRMLVERAGPRLVFRELPPSRLLGSA